MGAILLAALAASCGPDPGFYVRVDNLMASGDFSQAQEAVERNKSAYSKRERLLYFYDLGLTAHYAGSYEKSNENLVKAEQIAEELYTKSLTATGASFLINDYIQPYKGEDFERALIHLFKSLNYLKLGKMEDVLVEARQVDSKLLALNDRYPVDKKNVYREDALIRFITGMIYESAGKIEDALIDYMKSEEIFQDYQRNYGTKPPLFFLENLFSAAQGAGKKEEIEEYQKRYWQVRAIPYEKKKEFAEVIVIHYSGRSPVKVRTSFPAQIDENVVIDIAIPTYEKQARLGLGAAVSLQEAASGDIYSFETEVMEDLEAIALKNLENRLFRMTAKAIARVTAQYILIKGTAQKVREEYGEEAAKNYELLMSGLATMASQPDLRSCRSLPAEIRVGRALVPPGTYEAQALLPGKSVASSLGQFKLDAGQKEFILLRSIE